MAQQQAKIEVRQDEEADTGQKKRGRKPKAPKTTVEPAAKANVADPESCIMKTQAGYVQGYNAQALVKATQIIVAAAVTQEANDINQLHPMLTQANLETIDHPAVIGTALVDAGYCSEANLTEADPAGPALLIAPNKDWKQRQALREQPCPQGRIPARLSRRDRMERTLLTKRGRRLYKTRGQTVEPVFGQIKSARGCDRFMRRGKAACDSEWKVLCATHNLLKLWRSGKATWASRKESRGQVIESIANPGVTLLPAGIVDTTHETRQLSRHLTPEYESEGVSEPPWASTASVAFSRSVY